MKRKTGAKDHKNVHKIAQSFQESYNKPTVIINGVCPAR